MGIRSPEFNGPDHMVPLYGPYDIDKLKAQVSRL